jgi:DNA-binding MarR family transcriptional regulator
MVALPESAVIRAALLRKALADAAQRAALARRLGLTNNDVLAVQHLARSGELKPSQLSARLQLSSAGTTGLIQRLDRAGHIARDGHPHDRRSAVLRLTPEIQRSAAETWTPLVAEIDSLVNELPLNEAQAVQRFLESVADAVERHAKSLGRRRRRRRPRCARCQRCGRSSASIPRDGRLDSW